MWIDTHCHLDAPEFEADRDAVCARAAAAGVTMLVLPAVRAADFEAVRALAHRIGACYALGIHPLCTAEASNTDLQYLQSALERHRGDPRLVAVGEIGLDHLVAPPQQEAVRERQRHYYESQLALARRFELPVILHVRRSADALLAGLRGWNLEHTAARTTANACTALPRLAALMPPQPCPDPVSPRADPAGAQP
jgi:TatD DNase family protein